MMKVVRCVACSRKLAHGEFSVLEIKCPRCGAFNTHQRAQSPAPERPERLEDGTQHGSETQPEGARRQRVQAPGVLDRDEAHQRAVYERLVKMRLKLKVVAV